MLRNLVCSLFLAEPEEDQPRRVTTTIPKAKEARRVAERAITLGKRGDLHARRRAIALLGNKRAVKTLFDELAPLYSARNGGYTRILRLAKCRLGDGGDLCYFELVGEAVAAAPQAAEPTAPRVAPPTPAEEAPAAQTPAGEAEGAQQPAPEGGGEAQAAAGEGPGDASEGQKESSS